MPKPTVVAVAKSFAEAQSLLTYSDILTNPFILRILIWVYVGKHDACPLVETGHVG
jgi:hypothetical protein